MKVFGFSLFGLFPILLAITITWSLGGILTATEVFDSDSKCSTAQSLEYTNAVPWFYFPYPFQFGMPQFRSYAIVPMIGSMLASMVEVSVYRKCPYHMSFFCTTELQLTIHFSTQSTGDYYSCASLSGAPVPTAGIISRGIAAEGIGVIMSGLWGTGCGTTSYAENIGAIALTGVGSRAVVQCGAITMMILSIFAKFGKEICICLYLSIYFHMLKVSSVHALL